MVRKRRRRVARVERVVKEGMTLVFFFLLGWWKRMTERAWVAREGTVVFLVVVVGWSSSFPSDRDVICRVDDSTVTQSWEISNRVRVRDREMPCKQRNSRCERYALHLYTMHTHIHSK